ncbi:MAG: hypothetical protein U0R70_17060 [Solirubrobacteraceae bacterium]
MLRTPPSRVLAGVGLIAGATLALQVLLTRLLGTVLYYHFGFLAISLALLGLGGGAILIYVKPAWFERAPLQRTLARWSIGFAVLTAVGVTILVRLDYSLADGMSARFILTLAFACLLAALPLFASGIVIALAVRGYTRHIGRVYALDLIGAGIGAVAVVPLMWLVDAPTLIAALAVVGAAAAALFGWETVRDRRIAGITAAAATAFVAVAGATALLYVDPEGPLVPVADYWTPLARVMAYAPANGADGLVVYDRNVGQVISHRRGTPLPGWRRLQEGPPSIGYELSRGGRALVIGGGGGRDILTALSQRQRSVDVIELNRRIRDAVDGDLGAVSGSPYTLPRVSTTIGDGRSTLAARDKKYDHIQIGFVDTFSASSAQAFALTENNLYTVEAFREYYDHLAPRGVLNVSRPYRHVGDEALRATVLTLEALRRRGIRHPERNVVVVLGRYSLYLRSFSYAAVLSRLEPFTAAELVRIRRLARERGSGVAFAPGGPYQREWRQLAAASSPQAFCESYRLDVCAPTDDKPFFFFMKRFDRLGGGATSAEIGVPDPIVVLLITLGILLALAALAVVVPLALVRRQGRPPAGSLVYFAAIGLGFLMLEVVLIQRFVLFLGFPTYALSVVLFALLVSTGAGAALTARLRPDPRRQLVAVLATACALIAASSYGLGPLLRALIDLPFAGRLAVTCALLAPLGVLLGMAMPIGLRRLADLYPAGVPWAWGINGIASVVASVAAVTLAITFGFALTTVAAFGCYLVALADAAFGRWPEPEPPAAEPAPPAPPATADVSPAAI